MNAIGYICQVVLCKETHYTKFLHSFFKRLVNGSCAPNELKFDMKGFLTKPDRFSLLYSNLSEKLFLPSYCSSLTIAVNYRQFYQFWCTCSFFLFPSIVIAFAIQKLKCSTNQKRTQQIHQYFFLTIMRILNWLRIFVIFTVLVYSLS